jgi:hypothetical protein
LTVQSSWSRGAPAHDAPRWVAPVLGLFLLLIYLSNLRVLAAADSIPTRLLPFSILREGNLNLDEFKWLWSKRLPYYVRISGVHIYSGTTVALPLLLSPLYVLPTWYLSAAGIDYDDVRARLLIVVMERVCAALLTTIAAVLLYRVMCRLVHWRWALALTLIYAIGSNTWVIASQALWPHTLVGLALVLLAYVFVSESVSRLALVCAGLVTAIMVAERPQTAGIAVIAAVYVWRFHRRDILMFVGLPGLAALLVAVYNLRTFSNLAGAYVHFDHFSTPPWTGLWGLLLSPNRGLLVYSPIMVFGLIGAVMVWRRPSPPWIRWLVFALGWHLLLYGMFDEWWAGYTFGPRYLTDILPILTLLMVYGLVPYCRTQLAYALLAAVALYGVAVQAIGVYWDDDSWNRGPVSLQLNPRRVWDWHDWQVARVARGPYHGADLAPLLATVFRDEQPAFVRELTPSDLANTLEVDAAPSRFQPGQALHFSARLRNDGTQAWPAFTGDLTVRYTVFLIVQWYRDGVPIPGEGDVLRLPRNVEPGETVEVDVPLRVPQQPGSYQIELRVTQAMDGTRGIADNDPLRITARVE